ncbi:MAG: hypothetical protein ACFFBD_14025 [Candidatus Hodarchaeota archaeon]
MSEQEQIRHLKSRQSEFKLNIETGYSLLALKTIVILAFFLHLNLYLSGVWPGLRHIAVHPDYQR